jgi:hypothetical protein
MKKLFIIACLILICSSGLFAKSYTHRHHHWGEHYYTGKEIVTSEKVAKMSSLLAVDDNSYNMNDYVVYKAHEKEFIYSGCKHTDYEIEYAEIIRKATKDEINLYHLKKATKIIGIILLIVIVCVLEFFKETH